MSRGLGVRLGSRRTKLGFSLAAEAVSLARIMAFTACGRMLTDRLASVKLLDRVAHILRLVCWGVRRGRCEL